jgi:hypothetical protein
MNDGRAYAGLHAGTMQGNYGPDSKMHTALGAYTPNVPWAEIDCGKILDMDGAGTSAATPQIAVAAALWLAQHWVVVDADSVLAGLPPNASNEYEKVARSIRLACSIRRRAWHGGGSLHRIANSNVECTVGQWAFARCRT